MWTIGEIATRNGVSNEAVAKRARRLAVDHGLIVERDARGRIAKLNVVQFDQLCGRFGDPSKTQKPKVSSEKRPPVADSREEAMRQQAWIDAERSRLALEETKGHLVAIDDIRERIDSAAGLIADLIDRRANSADDIAAAVARDGAHGARQFLVQDSQRLRSEIAAALRNAAPPAPAEQEAAQPELMP